MRLFGESEDGALSIEVIAEGLEMLMVFLDLSLASVWNMLEADSFEVNI